MLQHELVGRIAAGLWRGRRSDRIEAALLARCLERAQGPDATADLGRAVIRDASGPRAIDTLLRYRASAQAELFRALGALRVLRAEAAPRGHRLAAGPETGRPPTSPERESSGRPADADPTLSIGSAQPA